MTMKAKNGMLDIKKVKFYNLHINTMGFKYGGL